MMRKLRFGERWISLVMTCVTSVTYSIMVNGNQAVLYYLRKELGRETLYLPIFLFSVQGLSALLLVVE